MTCWFYVSNGQLNAAPSFSLSFVMQSVYLQKSDTPSLRQYYSVVILVNTFENRVTRAYRSRHSMHNRKFLYIQLQILTRTLFFLMDSTAIDAVILNC